MSGREIVVPKMRVRRSYRKMVLLGVMLFVMVFLFTVLVGRFKSNEETEAANLDSFDPGYIISDYTMGNYNAMTEVEIQEFLTSKNSCANRDANYYERLSAGSAYTWHFENGHFVCLSEELFGDGEVIGTGETAAHILWQAAQDYKINPQVLIVLLQKETGLITDPIPNNGDYRKATGYGCPDTAPCSSEYYGFKNQIRKAAALFRTVLDGGWTNYPLGENYIQYNPSWDCGGSMVNIRSLATSALYRYTPYQPNAAALSAGYGYGDYCSAYGNRNFYHYFEDWFGGIRDEDIVPKAFRTLVNQLGDILGKEKTKIRTEKDGRIWQAFENGTIIYHESTGAHVVMAGVINAKWSEYGGSLGRLGRPVNDTRTEKDGRIWQTFENGTIISHSISGTYVVINGEISAIWAKEGGSLGRLGKPVSDLFEQEGWRWQSFENGGVAYSEKSGAIVVMDSDLFEVWVRTVVKNEIELGDAITDCRVELDGRHWQTYENGVIIYHADSGGYVILNGPIHDVWAKGGGSLGKYGRPISDQIQEENELTQEFIGGTITVPLL